MSNSDTHEIRSYMKEIKENSYMIHIVPKQLQTKEICLFALNSKRIHSVPILQYVRKDLIDKEISMLAVSKNGMELQYVPEEMRTFDVCVSAVEDNENAIQFIPDGPDISDIYSTIIENDGTRLRFISSKYITEELCSKAFENKTEAFCYIPKEYQTKSMCEKVIDCNGNYLQFVDDEYKTEELCKKALSDSKKAVFYMPRGMQTYKMFLDVMADDGKLLEMVPTEYRTEELCKIAFENSEQSIRYMPKNIRIKYLKEAIEKDGMLLEYFAGDEKTDEICEMAVMQNWETIKFVPQKRMKKAICEEAVKKSINALEYIPESKKTKKLYMLSLEKNALNLLHMPTEMRTPESIGNLCKVLAGVEKIELSDLEIRRIEDGITEEHLFDKEVVLFELYYGLGQIFFRGYKKTEGKFVIEKTLGHDEKGFPIIKRKEFESFDEFYFFFDGNMNGADLREYDFAGIDCSLYNLDGAILSTQKTKELGQYEDVFFKTNIESCIANRTADEDVVEEKTDLEIIDHSLDFINHETSATRHIYYASDIHIEEYLLKRHPDGATKDEVYLEIEDYVEELVKTANDTNGYLLIAGDVVSESFELSEMFYSLLSCLWRGKIIVTLGNHEIFSFNKLNSSEERQQVYESIVQKYREMLNNYNVILLENELLMINGDAMYSSNQRDLILDEEEIQKCTIEELQTIYKEGIKSDLVILGGIGFSGYNKIHNAIAGFYRETVRTLEEDLYHTRRFESIYDKIKEALGDRKLIVMTHTPKSNWSQKKYNDGWTYVSGHTHRNTYIKEDNYCVYADNQLNAKAPGLKYFATATEYDALRFYEDGIHEITRNEYRIMYQSKIKTSLDFNRADGHIYLLKRNEICMFMYENKEGKLYLLNGGKINNVERDINYYYDNMIFQCHLDKHFVC